MIVRNVRAPLVELLFYNNIIAVLLMSFIVFRKGYRETMPKGKALLGFPLIGILSVTNTMAFFYAYQNTSVANTILTHYIAPVLVAFLAPFFLNEPLTKKVFLSVVIASAGLWILLGKNPAEIIALLQSPSRDSIGIMSGLLSGVAYAFMLIVLRKFAQNYNPLVLTFLQNLTVAIIIAPFVRGFPVADMYLIAITGIVHSTIAPIIYYKGLSNVTANRAAILGYFEPIGAIIFGMIFFREYPTIGALLGGLLIIYSGYISVTEKK